MSEIGVGEKIEQSINPRAISKEIDQPGRESLAKEFWQQREVKSETRTTEKTLEERENHWLVKLKEKLSIPDKEKQVLQAQLLELKTKESDLPDPKKMIEAYYEKMSETALTNEEKRELLKPEALADLSTQEYVALWKRLNPYFISHTTRQGFRDHFGMIYHSGGMSEYHNGFVGILQDEKSLRPPFAVESLRARDEASVRKFMGDWVLKAETEEQARERFNTLMHFSLASAPKYPDKTAVHFMTEIVGNQYYGGESNNEFFFIFPADVIASQYTYAFNGWEKDFTRPQSEQKWNDVFVWPQSLENPKVMVDSGLAFIPKNTMVDRKTGSKYESELQVVDGVEKKVMIEDFDLKQRFETWAESLTDESVVVRGSELAIGRNDLKNYQQILFTELNKIGFDEEGVNSILNNLYMSLGQKVETSQFKSNLMSAWKESTAKYLRAKDKVRSEDYWEDYFSQQPELRPKHLIYYDGSPTRAVDNFIRENGIGRADVSKEEGKLLGFDDNMVLDMVNDPRPNRGHDELLSIGYRIIKEEFSGK